jgi:hypothetical protein
MQRAAFLALVSAASDGNVASLTNQRGLWVKRSTQRRDIPDSHLRITSLQCAGATARVVTLVQVGTGRARSSMFASLLLSDSCVTRGEARVE